ncbi:MAG: histidine kinase [Saprospiraceae bacterium]|nr:histidine kinase [Saprospiraceae bacterium]MDW8228717.1 histidine kinase [Saprospiraceae bacterium]
MRGLVWVRKVFWAALLIAPLSVWPQQVAWTNYTTRQGLPANVAYEVWQSRDDHLWFTTEAGICRFNGYEFVRPVDTSTWNGAEAFIPTEDLHGRIWFARIDGSLWYVQHDTVHPFEHSARLEPFRRRYQLPMDIQADADGNLWLAYNHLGLLRIDPEGHVRDIRSPTHRVLLYAEIGGRAMIPVVSSPEAMAFRRSPVSTAVYREGSVKHLTALPVRPLLDVQYRGFWKLRSGDVLHAYDGVYYLLRADSVLWQARLGFTARRLAETSEGALLLAVHMGERPGLFYFSSVEDLRRGRGQNLLPGCFVTDIRIDRWGGWWATTHHAGLFYCKNPGIEVFDQRQGLPSDEVTCLAFDGKNRLFAGFRPAALVALRLESDRMERISLPRLTSRDVEVLLFDTARGRLWCSAPLYFQENGRWQTALQVERNAVFAVKSLSKGPRSGRLWGPSSSGFFETEASSGRSWHRRDADEPSPYARTFDVAEDANGVVWVITHRGLRQWRHGRYEPPPWAHPALRFQPRHVCLSSSGAMAIGLRSAGVLIRAPDGRMTHLRRADGLASDQTMRMYAGPDGAFYACSNDGLSRLTPRPDGGWDVRALTRREGLPSGQVSDVEVAGGYLWIATHRGLVRLRRLPELPPMPPPRLERLWVNNRPADFIPNRRLPHDSNTLRLRFYALHYPSEGEIQYRYRLLGADTTFTYSNVREVLLANLAHGQYTFEVQAQSPSGQWSAPTRWSFHVCPAWWQTVWFWMLLSLAVALALALAYRWRLRQKHQQTAAMEKIRQLEAAALRAQMNPHFIFNCLNSIQHFIADNNADAATHYLACFARLVRLALHGAVDGRHSLREEIDMLSNYLALEQLRFRNRFEYRITTEPALNLDDVTLPPLLVQPFVENALLHGLQNKQEGGLITVTFALDERHLTAAITDNGPGMKTTDDAKRAHKSVGMMLTQRRLALLSEDATSSAQWENLTLPDGTPAGLRVTLRIPLEA